MTGPKPPEILDFHARLTGETLVHLLQLDPTLGAVLLAQGLLDLAGRTTDPASPPGSRLRIYAKNGLPFTKDSGDVVRSIAAIPPVAGTMVAADGTALVPVAPGDPGQVLTFDPETPSNVAWNPPGQPPDVPGQHQASTPFVYTESPNPAASQIQYTRVFITQGIEIASMKVFHINGGNAARFLNMGIYDQADPDDDAGQPFNKLAETGAFDTNVATNTFIISALSGGDLTIPQTGFFWIACVSDTATPLQFSGTGVFPAGFVPVFAETTIGTTLPATASSLSNPGGSVLFAAALEA